MCVCVCVALQAPNINVFNSIPLHINIMSSSMQYTRMERIHASSCKVNKDTAFLRCCELTLIFLRNPRFANIWYASFMREIKTDAQLCVAYMLHVSQHVYYILVTLWTRLTSKFTIVKNVRERIILTKSNKQRSS